MKPKGTQDMRWWLQPWFDGFFDAYANSDFQDSDTDEEAPTIDHEADSDEDVSISEIRHVVDSV